MKKPEESHVRGGLDRRSFVQSALAVGAAAALPVAQLRAQSAAGPLEAAGLSGNALSIPRSDIDAFAASLRGELILPGSPQYEQARKIWNGSFDKFPSLIARCTGAADVVAAVKFARAHGILTAVRGGGHSISGQSVCDKGLVIDLSRMKAIRIDPKRKIAEAQPGVLLGELDREAQAFGLITTLGTASDTGIAGLTLGGGLGRLARRYGLTCDNLLAVDIVTAKGELLQASERENPDLYWAVRGGGGNFGIVTRFEYRLHQFGPNVLGGYVMFPYDDAPRILLALTEFAADAPDEMYLNPMIGRMPTGRGVGFEVCYGGDLAEGERLIAPLMKLAKPITPPPSSVSYLEVQRRADAGLPPGRSYYFKSGFMSRVKAGDVNELLDTFEDAPPYMMGVPFIHLRGAVARVKPEATAFWNRDAYHDLAIWAAWNDRAESERNIATVRAFWKKLEHLTKGYYINTDTPDDDRRLRETFGGNYERLVQAKNKYDPTNLFRLNSNIKPTVKT
jgi:FAD/FMN-containing dehydrogenase